MPSIVDIWEQFKGRRGTVSQDKVEDDRVFHVVMDDGTATTYDVLLAMETLGIIRGAVHPINPWAVIRQIAVRNDLAPKMWKATVSYSTLNDDRKHETDPDLDPLQVSVDEEKFQRPAITNRDDEAILTSSGTRPDPPVMVEDTNRIVNIEGSVAGTLFPAWESGFRNRINSAPFTIYDTGRVVTTKRGKVRSITLGKVDYRGIDGTIPFRPFKIQIEILDPDEPDFDERTRYLDISTRRKPTAQEIADGKYVEADRPPVRNPDGTDSKEPQLLDGDGLELDDPSPATAVFLESKTLRLANFAGNLPGCV